MSTLPTGYSFGQLNPADRAEIVDLEAWTFYGPGTVAQRLEVPFEVPYERTFGVRAETGALAAMHSSQPFDLQTPGGHLPVAGLTWVMVNPAYRRRGLLRYMIEQHLHQCQERGEAFSMLTASEAPIYGRFGYGMSSHNLSLDIPRGAKRLTGPADDSLNVRLEVIKPERHLPIIAEVMRKSGQLNGINRPGWALRDNVGMTPELQQAMIQDSPQRLLRYEESRILIVERAGVPVAFANFARTRSADAEIFDNSGKVYVYEHAEADPDAANRLWEVLLDLDLTDTVHVSIATTDDPLFVSLVDPGAANPRLGDFLWIRIVDLVATMTGRQYAAPVDAVFQVTDETFPGNVGTWRLRADAFSSDVSFEPTNLEPDFSLDITQMGALYLGEITLNALAGTGIITVHSPGKLAATSTALTWPVAPSISWGF
jgi:predicted acetyltransferase